MTERREGADGSGEERDPALPADEEAAWAQIVAAYDGASYDRTEAVRPEADGDVDPADPDRTGADADGTDASPDADGTDAGHPAGSSRSEDREPSRSFTVYAAGIGPRDWRGPDEVDDDDHFTPPEPPPLPETDPATTFAWIAAIGGPLLLIGAVMFDVYLSWWIVTLGVGGFLGGFATLLTRLRDDHDEDLDDPGNGAVV
ncbi:hypothetical protein N566_18340 [Streptomycetaceae bacterium MP113-05]|nr:hypothetical protein N566_18340 [Streptomycetaceae bacterium MP113-05]